VGLEREELKIGVLLQQHSYVIVGSSNEFNYCEMPGHGTFRDKKG
jgi:hypothetical protein